MQAPEDGRLVRIAACGSVDDGKSTLIGRILVDTGTVPDDHLEGIRDRSGHTDLAKLTDGLRDERERGITIDVARRYFTLDDTAFVLADCPGHTEYTRNVVGGVSGADIVVLVVDVTRGVREQTLRHLAIAGVLDAPRVVVAANKIDLVDDPVPMVARLATVLRTAAARYSAAVPEVVPVSAITGQNVVARSPLAGYSGPSLLELLRAHRDDDASRPFRFLVQGALDVSRSSGVRSTVTGRVVSGSAGVGQSVTAWPAGRPGTIDRIDEPSTTGDRPVEEAMEGAAVTLCVSFDAHVGRGAWLGAGSPMEVGHVLEADVVWVGDRAVSAGERVFVKHGTRTVAGTIEVVASADLLSGAMLPAVSLRPNDLGRVTVSLDEVVAADPYRTVRTSGAFVVIDPVSYDTVAAGMVRRTMR